MDGFTIVDGVVAVIILISAILAYSRGLTRELLAILGWVAAAIGAYMLTPMAQPLVQEIPVINEILAESCQLSILATFVVVFVVALLLLAIIVPLFAGAVRNSAAGGIDQALGFLFGVARGALLVIVALIIYDEVLMGDPIDAVDNSRTMAIFSEIEDDLATRIPDNAPDWIVERFEELTGDCGAPAGTVEPDTAPTGEDTPATEG